jgi:tyrosinase
MDDMNMREGAVAQAGTTMAHRLMPETFSGLLREQFLVDRELRFVERFKIPRWFLPTLVYERKDQSALTDVEQQRFLCALNVLIANGTYGNLVAIHSDMSHMMHGSDRFLPWHRVYLIQLEQALQAIHPDVAIPYWDWTNASEQSVPAWLAAFTPTVPTPNGPIPVVRGPGSSSDLATIASNIPAVMTDTTYTSFRPDLEGVHGMVHVWVGGSMSSIATAPADPIFWMHHANIDRIWWNWYNSPAGSGQDPSLSGAAAVMDPWPTTEPDTRDISAMGYTYV